MKQLGVTIWMSFIFSTIVLCQNNFKKEHTNEMDKRELIFCPKPTYSVQDTGVVKINYWIDKDGNVIKAQQDSIETTAINKVLIKEALVSAYKLKFSAIKKDTVMKGSFTYYFDLE
ncbi:energy transducer TonB [Carboxylicivirga linearis]|uniref:TonB C-terminal domain-containing protein n=1 Tax=Carboxylicivirga linearis TaxID=1628157 RepID=A0ABS5K014_9BACT|nr:hypothetical protein [Carboxylicivirga linearis]MBS2100006.1 hypothetical protein [Carboxylicivirga linearis]